MEIQQETSEDYFSELKKIFFTNECSICKEDISVNSDRHKCLKEFCQSVKGIIQYTEEKVKQRFNELENRNFSVQTRLIDLEERIKFLNEELDRERLANTVLTDKIEKILISTSETLLTFNDPVIEAENKSIQP